MKRTRILSAVCMALVCCLFCLGAAAESGTCGDNLRWMLDNDGKLTISGQGAMTQYAYYYDSPWYQLSSIQSVVIEDGVTSIGDYAFTECTGIKSVTIPGSVTHIGDSAFKYCSGLKQVTIPGSVTNIGQYAFNNCTDLTDLEFLDSAAGNEMVIWTGAFLGCNSLKSVAIPGSVKSIKESVFKECTSLLNVTIPDSVTSIEACAFEDCSVLKDIYYCGSQTEWDNVEKGEEPDNEWDLDTPSDKTIHVFAAVGTGSETKPYIIQSADQWNTLSVALASGTDTAGKQFKLDGSPSVSTMIGTKKNPFKGTFDGNGNTLRITLGNEENSERTAPFSYVCGAAIRNLHVTGSVTGSANRASGLIGENAGVTRVENCRVSAELSGKLLISGFCSGTGGAGEEITCEGCVFDGKITGTDQCGGFVAWLGENSSLRLTDCVCAPESSSAITEGGTFYFKHSSVGTGATAALTNCWYLTPLGTGQGKQAYTITKGQGVDVDYGTIEKNYTVGGIAVYPTKIKLGELFCASQGDELKLIPIPGPGDGQTVQFFGDDDQPLARGTGKTWLMPGRNVTIRAEVKSIEAYGTPTFTLPAGTKAIGKNAFAGIAAQVVYVPGSDNPYPIEARAFASCPNLTQIRLPKNCDIDGAAFWGCQNLTAIYAPGGGSTEDWAKENGYGFISEPEAP